MITRFILVLVFVLTVRPAQALPHVVIDFETGNILSHQQAFDPWHPASLTKLMTAYSIFKAIETGEFSSDKVVRVTKNARRQPPSRMGYRTGTRLTMDDALKLLLIKSANDISVAIAEAASGSVEAFSDRMNRDAAALGMTGSRFVNPHGLHDRRQVTTARDMALLVQALHRNYPQYKSFFDTPSVLAPSRTKNGKIIKRIYYSYNLLLERYRGADGFKTGFVCASGYNFIGSATRAGRRIAAVVLGRDSQTSRAVDAAKLITEGFQLPIASGVSIENLAPSGAVPTGPRNMRNVLCTQEARAKRYEPGAGQAVIKSPWLETRSVTDKPLTVAFASGTAAARVASIPLPKFRPSIAAIAPAGSKLPTTETAVQPVMKISAAQTPLPKFRPAIR